MTIRTNLLIRRFSRCSMQVKVQLCKSFCICFYNIALWENFHVYCLNKFASAYVKCIKIFFGFHKYSSVTNMLLQLGLPSFRTVLRNARIGLLIICTFLILMLCLSHAGCDMTAYMQCYCTCACFHVFMRPSSLGGGRIMRRTLSVRLSVRPSRYRCHR